MTTLNNHDSKDKDLNITVIKRDGSKKPYKDNLIERAILLAAKEAEESNPEVIASSIKDIVTLKIKEAAIDVIQINEIQVHVENELMRSFPKTARHYIEYRHTRDIAREKESLLMSEISGLVRQTNTDVMNENANKDSKVIATQRDLLAGIVAKHYARNHMLPKDVVLAHDSGEIHYHDLDYSPFFPMFNCMIVDLTEMLTNGFKMGNADIDTPRSIQTATAVTAQIIAQVASNTYGGTTLNRLDEVLAPYVTASYNKNIELAKEWAIPEAEKFSITRTEKEVHDAFQSLEYELNTLHSANGQTPFISIGYGLGTSWESRLIQKAIMNNRILGLGKNAKTAIFPKLLYTLKEGVNLKPNDPNYDVKLLALECASKRMYPDILNYDKIVEVTGSFKAPMGCRSFLNKWLDEDGNEVHDGRNNMGVVSINLPRIALEANGDEKLFYEILDKRLKIARKALDTRIESLQGVKASVAPILYCEGALGFRLKPEDYIIDIFKDGRASISLGYIGIHETINALYGSDVHIYDNEELRTKGLEIVRTLKEAVTAWGEETGFGFSLYSTPSENLCSRFCKIDSKQFGVVPGVTSKGYYTNSFHLDVEKKVNPFDKIDFEKPYTYLASGGFISYGEFPNMQHNLAALEKVWDYAYYNTPYYGTNTPIDECYDCGHSGEFECTSKGFQCPNCGNNDPKRVSVTRRVCGYLGSPDARPFNDGKQEEVIRRIKHM